MMVLPRYTQPTLAESFMNDSKIDGVPIRVGEQAWFVS